MGKSHCPQNCKDRQADKENHSLLLRNPGSATSMETSVGVEKPELYVKVTGGSMWTNLRDENSKVTQVWPGMGS